MGIKVVVKGKISGTGSNISDRLEDLMTALESQQLTGQVIHDAVVSCGRAAQLFVGQDQRKE